MTSSQAGTEARGDGVIGVDIGGTHTDLAVLFNGRSLRAKTLTTYDDFSRGVLQAVDLAAEGLGVSREQLLAETQLMMNATTIVTNAITELRGSRVGVLVTTGCEDVFRLAGARLPEFDDHLQLNLPDIAPRSAIVGIDERIDWAGNVLVRVDPAQVEAQTRRLVEEERVEAVAICFLSSFANPVNEVAAENALRQAFPDLFVTLSHRVFPVVGETRRFTTAVLNSFVQARAATYLDSLNTTLREAGLTGGLAFFQGLGGGIGHERAKEFPLSLLGSGPAAGARGAADLTKRTGHSKVLLGDMGGTSFDTGMIVDHEVRITKSLQLGPFRTGVNVMDLVSVGAGGGSVVWVSERGVPQVGPQSAGSTPGPVALDRGGTEPTVTDALITLGFIDPARYLDGRVKVDPSLARTALERTLGQRFGWSAEEAASAVHDLVVVNMANAVREVSIGKGYDPREFVFLAYGGTLPLFASQIAERLGITTIIVPRDSSVFCARGLLASDFVLRLDQAVGWDLSRPERFDRANAVADSLTAAATAAIQKDGFHEDDCTVLATADFRFQSQEYELTMAMPQRELREEDAAGLHAQFVELYEKTYGQGTAWEGVPSTMVNYSVTVTGHRPHPPAVYADGDSGAGGSRVPPVREYREVYLPTARARETVPIVDDAALTAGMTIRGPAMVDGGDTTVYVPSGTSAARDSYGNLVLTRGGSPNAGS